MRMGSLIRERRELRRLSQADVARFLGLRSLQSISNIERGVSPLPAKNVKKLSRILQIDKNELVEIAILDHAARYLKRAGIKP